MLNFVSRSRGGLSTLSQVLGSAFLMTCIGLFYNYNQMDSHTRRHKLGVLHGKGFLFRLVAVTASLVAMLWMQQQGSDADPLAALAASPAVAGAAGTAGVAVTEVNLLLRPVARLLFNVGVVSCAVACLCLSHYVEGLHARHRCAGDTAARRLLARISKSAKLA